jgi:hypothetical protein
MCDARKEREMAAEADITASPQSMPVSELGSDRITTPVSEMPRSWYNVLADLPFPLLPPISPATGQPVSPEELLRIFPLQLLEQKMSQERLVAIPVDYARPVPTQTRFAHPHLSVTYLALDLSFPQDTGRGSSRRRMST